MRKIAKYLVCLLLLLAAVNVCEAKKKQGGYRKVYAFGFASSFTDSLAYLTDIQEIDSAYVLPNGFIADRSLYSIQLYGHVNEKLGMENPTTAFFFSLENKKLEKKHNKVKNMYLQHPDVRLMMLSRNDFAFKAEEYMEPIIMETVEGEDGQPQGKKAQKAAKKAAKKAKKETAKARKEGGK